LRLGLILTETKGRGCGFRSSWRSRRSRSRAAAPMRTSTPGRRRPPKPSPAAMWKPIPTIPSATPRTKRGAAAGDNQARFPLLLGRLSASTPRRATSSSGRRDSFVLRSLAQTLGLIAPSLIAFSAPHYKADHDGRGDRGECGNPTHLRSPLPVQRLDRLTRAFLMNCLEARLPRRPKSVNAEIPRVLSIARLADRRHRR
jgi:hypothetical protein